MRDGDFGIRGEAFADSIRVMMKGVVVAAFLAACGDSNKTAASTNAPSSASAAVAPLPGAAPSDASCPATGLWAHCSILYRLGRAGVVPHLDSADHVDEKSLHAADSFVLKIGATARLDVFVYPDSTARIADEKHLDLSKFKRFPAELTINRERTLIESGNVLALLTSIQDRQRERVSDALTAGAPQPSQPAPPRRSRPVTVRP